jgi:hypothetical protein
MKKIKIFIAILMIGITSSFTYQNDQQEYLKGWKDGHCEGWKDVKGQFAVCPVTPVAPVPEVGLNTYKGGYNRGFKRGTEDAKKSW